MIEQGRVGDDESRLALVVSYDLLTPHQTASPWLLGERQALNPVVKIRGTAPQHSSSNNSYPSLLIIRQSR
ncbi:hypothetical protein RRG08_027270 [Elysia crispata]|uniref:Uncharacterized protein n=1 Tax=Elysia crispata TaxID=231223 RepID=A0AAE0ZR62_9GAST|nr:hypothetical protein RRG08_027270 [Elysia crispata]